VRSLQDAFDALVDLPPKDRESRLRAFGLSPSEHLALQAMLDADAGGSSIVDIPIADAIDRLCIGEHLSERAIGSKVGSFRIVELIGEGGSSVVFRAERAAGTGSQWVALKMLRAGMFSPSAERRFRREHTLLAQLNHPNIARLIEGGVSDGGIPYIAMELVEGEAITLAAARRALGLEARLRLFSRLCRTVGAAHAALIVHRDLKPSNVLVDASGELKIVDFGIAKLLHTDQGEEPTQTISLTPEYAAPEQFHRGHQTVAVDVYALGIMLGELVTGTRARGRAPSSVVAESGDAISNGLPPRQTLQRRLRGDIDAIVAMASAENPAHRYPSVEALAADVDRWLAAQPVLARPPSTWYRMGKFFERHRAGVVLTAVLTLSILGSLAIAIAQRAAAVREAANARAEAARADSMRDFMFEAFAEAEPRTPRDGPATVLDVVARALVASRSAGGADVRARLELRTRLVEVLQAQGDLDGARNLLVELKDEATRSLGMSHVLTLSILELVARNSMLRGDFAAARAEVDEALLHSGTRPSEARVMLLATSAVIATKERALERALAEARHAVALVRTLDDPELQKTTLNDLGVVLLSTDNIAEAATVYEEVLALNQSIHGTQHRNVATTKAALARVYRRLGDLDRAEELARGAIAIDHAIYPDDDWHLTTHLNALMLVLRSKGDLHGAFDTAREAFRIASITLGDDHPETVNAQYGVGTLAAMLDDYGSAAPLLRNALMGSQLKFGASHRETAIPRAWYGFVIAMGGNAAEGIPELERAIADLEALTYPDPDNLSLAIEKRIHAALHAGDGATAMQWVSRLERYSSPTPATPAHWVGNVDMLRGAALLASHRATEAVDALRRAGQSIDAATHIDPRIRVEQRLLLASALLAAGDQTRATTIAAAARERMQELMFVPRRLKLLEAALPK
jgi:eukaryotic-like serine/threonine-protein kinase